MVQSGLLHSSRNSLRTDIMKLFPEFYENFLVQFFLIAA